MTRKTTHRILAVLVLISLIVIALPFVSRHEHQTLDNPLRSAPPFPDQSEQVIAPDDVDAPVTVTPTPMIPTITPATPVAPTEIPAALPGDSAMKMDRIGHSAWAVEIGDYHDKLAAVKMVDALRGKGYHAFIQVQDGEPVRVFIGPENKKSEAIYLANHVKAQLNVQGMIVNYKPLML